MEKDNSPSRFKINGSIIADGSFSEKAFNEKWNEFLNTNGLRYIGIIEKTRNIIIIPKTEKDDDLNILWESVIEVIAEELSEVSFDTWIKPIQPYSMKDNKLNLVVESNFSKGILDARYSKLIKSAIRLITNTDFEIIIYTREDLI